MKKNSKFLMIYVAILFSFALLLILFAGLTQNNYAKKIAESQGIKDNLVELTQTNQTLTDSIKLLNADLDEANQEIEQLKANLDQLNSNNDTTNQLIIAYQLYESGKKDEAKEKISAIDKTVLTETQLYIYNKIK